MRFPKFFVFAAILALTVVAGCESSPTTEDDVTPIVGAWAARGAVATVSTAGGPRDVRFVEQWTFSADSRFVYEVRVIEAQTETLLGYLYRESGTFSLHDNAITTRRTLQETRSAEPWSMTLTVVAGRDYTSQGFWAVVGERLDLRFICNDTASCVLPPPYTRVAGI